MRIKWVKSHNRFISGLTRRKCLMRVRSYYFIFIVTWPYDLLPYSFPLNFYTQCSETTSLKHLTVVGRVLFTEISCVTKWNRNISSVIGTSVSNSLFVNLKHSSFLTCRRSRGAYPASSWDHFTPQRPRKEQMETNCKGQEATKMSTEWFWNSSIWYICIPKRWCFERHGLHIKKRCLEDDPIQGRDLSQYLLLLKLNSTQVTGDPQRPGPKGPPDGDSIRVGWVSEAVQAPSIPSMGLLVYHPDHWGS